ncbi:DUF3152 domain-containing protein [Streptomyces sp. NPDC052236]|uniref:DUF3152 domain-containing protein n=1 Tax=Streptomyces sp. NPDC052236 TaxID=3365686 RepID=UPI0037D29655
MGRIGGRRAAALQRQRKARIRTLTTVAIAAAVVGGAAFTALRDNSTGTDAGSDKAAGADATDSQEQRVPVAPASPTASPSSAGSPSTPPARPRTTPAPGSFSTARADSKVHGKGTIHRYKVQVETATGLSVNSAADEISAVLGDSRGWTATGRDGFRRVSSDENADLTVKIATPDTVDDICGAAGLRTRGEVNCSIGPTVVVNLKRWLQGSPQFDGPIGEYRALIINHEVGHSLGRGHETCPGAGKPAPAMMQQIDGLKGCVANAWPYDKEGRYLSGPAVP